MKNKEIFLGEPIDTQSLVNTVLNRIKEALLNEELKPGDTLPSESEIAFSLNVGKTSVREALKMLQSLGVVEIRRGRNTRIRESISDNVIDPVMFQLLMQERQISDILELRMVFEPVYTILAMEKATSEDIKEIGDTITSFELKIREGRQTAEDDLAFHYSILKSTHNPLLIKIGQVVLQLFKASIAKSMKMIPEIALRDHKKIYKAFLEKDKGRIETEIIKSFSGWKKSLMTKSVNGSEG